MSASADYISFTAFGQPITQGSKKSDAIYKKGPDGKPQPVTKDGRVVTISRDDNPKLKSWRSTVAEAAMEVYAEEVILAGVALELTFMFPRPASHYGSGRNERALKPSAPTRHTQRPDVSKLTRAVEDALTGVLWADDSQVYEATMRKEWVERWERAGVKVVVMPQIVRTHGEVAQALQTSLVA